MLLNSRSGRIHQFPVPEWDPPAEDAISKKNEVAFRNFQARGGFLVSACKNGYRVYHVEIEAQRDTQCSLMNPRPGHPVTIQEKEQGKAVPAPLDTSNGECIIFSALAGHKYLVLRRT